MAHALNDIDPGKSPSGPLPHFPLLDVAARAVDYQSVAVRPSLLRWLECAALVPATFLLAPFMLYGILGMAIALAGVSLKPWGMAVAGPMLRLVGQMLVGCASLACLWFLLLRGIDAVKPVPRRRWLAISVLLLGLADATQFLVVDPKVTRELVSSTTSILLWVSLLVLPMLVGARYLLLLLLPVREVRP